MAKLGDIASVVRSKNAGPFHLTFDILFADHDTYERVKATGLMSAQTFGDLYGLASDKVEFHDYPLAHAFKFSIQRPLACGDIGDCDIYGAQQHAPLLLIEVPMGEP